MTVPAPLAAEARRLAIMQPYFFPYLGHFDLIRRTDLWVVFDVVQYRPKSWMNRNRILHPESGWQYVTVPVRRRGRDTAIRDVELVDPATARRRIRGQLDPYRRDAPFFDTVVDLLDEAFDGLRRGTLCELNVRGLVGVCRLLDLPFRPIVCSELELDLPPIEHPGQWALEIASRLGATDYVNPAAGAALFRPDEFAARGIGLHLVERPPFRYACGSRSFVEHLSILDVLMWNAPPTVRAWLEQPGC